MDLQDRADITDLVNRHGHLVDAGQSHRLDEVMARDVVHDLTDFGLGVRVGLDALGGAAPPGDANPLGHHVTNIVLTEQSEDVIVAVSKGIGVMVDGRAQSVVYDDRIERRADGWRIVHRTIHRRREPMRP